MITEQEALEILRATVDGNLKHCDYTRVTELSKKYKALASGEGIDDFLEKYFSSQTEDDRKKILSVTQAITPSVYEQLIKPARRIARMNNVREIHELIDGSDEAQAEFNNSIANFYGDEDVSFYMEQRWVDLSSIDPNSFIVVDFKEFDSTKDIASPYPLEVSSWQAIDYEYDNNSLHYLTTKFPINVHCEDDSTREGFKWTTYFNGGIVRMTEVEKITQIEGEDLKVFTELNGKHYLVQTFDTGAATIQAVRVGFKQDLVTDGRTLVSFIEPAMPWLEKLLKLVAEMDLTNVNHVFTEKYMYGRKCRGVADKGCDDNGKNTDGKDCAQCNGSGVLNINTAGDMIIFDMPLPDDPEDMVKLSDLVHYVEKPIELFQHQWQMVKDITDYSIKSVYSTEAFTSNQISKTATEKLLDSESTNDALQPLAHQYSSVWKVLVRKVGEFTDKISADKKAVIEHIFPKDFKLKSLDTLVGDLETIHKAGGSSSMKSVVEANIMEKVFKDNTTELNKFRVRESFNPFRGDGINEIQQKLVTGTIEKDRILHSNFNSIFDSLENDDVDFYVLERSAQVTKLNAKIEEYKSLINAERANEFGNIDTGIGG